VGTSEDSTLTVSRWMRRGKCRRDAVELTPAEHSTADMHW